MSAVRRIGPTPWGKAFASLGAAVTALGPLAVSERAFGLHQPVANQEYLLPGGLAAAAAIWWSLRAFRQTSPPGVLEVAADRLSLLTSGQPAVTFARSSVGAVIVDGDDLYGGFNLVVHDPQSRVLQRWTVRWPGRRPAAVVKALTRAGWPAAVGAELYDGRFQSQVEGQAPVITRPTAPS